MLMQLDDLTLLPQLWIHLPLEIKREIFVHLALCSPRLARDLRLVSSDVNVLVLPLLFRDLDLTTPNQVNQFVTTLLPKRRNSIPALKSKLHILPRPLSTYNIDSLALGINYRRPSVENALASVAPAFCGLTKFATSGQNLASHAYWLRQHPIYPQKMFIFHHGSPHLVNFTEPIFSQVTHLFTSITHGHRYSSVSDLPALTHLAIHTRTNLLESTKRKVASALKELLIESPQLKLMILSIQCDDLDDPSLEKWSFCLEQQCLRDSHRFVFLPDCRNPRMDWLNLVDGKPTIWDYADAWRSLSCSYSSSETGFLQKRELFMRQQQETEEFDAADNWRNTWEIDLVERDNYSAIDHDEGSIEYGGELQYNTLG